MTPQGLATRILAVLVGIALLVVAGTGLDKYATKKVSDVGRGRVYGPYTKGHGSDTSYGLQIKADSKSGAETSENQQNAALYHLVTTRGGADKTLPAEIYYDSGSDEVARVVVAGQTFQISESASSALAVGITLLVVGGLILVLGGVSLVGGIRKGRK